MKAFLLLAIILSVLSGCTGPSSDEPAPAPVIRSKVTVVFPDLPSIDGTVYRNIQEASAERWDLEKMKMDTFHVRPDRDEYVVECDGIVEGELYRCVIRADSKGKWINDGRAKKTP